jgi:hypothetical protein
MADLKEFLGGLVSSISESRVQSDLQTITIAKEYAKDNLLQNFAIPRLRIENVELTIPIAIEDTQLVQREAFKNSINNAIFSKITLDKVLETFEVKELPSDYQRVFQSKITDYVNLFEAQLKVDDAQKSLETYVRNIVEFTGENMLSISKAIQKRAWNKQQLVTYQTKLEADLKESLFKEIIEENELKSFTNIIVEASKLREIKPENLIMIKMNITEQGMEWIKMENSDGKEVSKLMPE